MSPAVITTIIIFGAFIGLCVLLFFFRTSKSYEDIAKAPLDDSDIDDRQDKHKN